MKSALFLPLLLFLSPAALRAAPDEVTLMLPPQDPARATWERLEAEFNRDHPEIRFQIVWSDITRKIHLLTVAGALPDLVLLPDFQLPVYGDVLLDLDPRMAAAPEEKERIYPVLLDACRLGGVLKMVPVYYNVPFVFYRPDLFRAAGVPLPDARWTWADFRDAARRLTRRNADGTVEVYGANVFLNWWVQWLSLVRQAGGDLLDETGRVRIGEPATAAAAGFLHDLIHVDHSAPLPVDAPANGFISGKYAMFYGGHVIEIRPMRQAAPFEWDIAPLPAGPAGRATGEFAVGGIGISRKARHPDAAWTVLRFLSGREAGGALCRDGFPPVRDDVAREVFLAGTPETRTAPRHPEVIIDSLAFARSVPKSRDFQPLAMNCVTPLLSAAVEDPDPAGIALLPGRAEAAARGYLDTLREKPRVAPGWFVAETALLLVGVGIAWKVLARRKPGVHPFQPRATRNFLLFAIPFLCGLALLDLFPIAASFYWAHTDYNLAGPARYVGLGQFRALLAHDPDFWHSVRLTLAYAALVVPLGIVLSLGAALLLNRQVRGIGLFRSVFYLPSILPVAASGMLWAWVLNPHGGLANRLLAALDIPGPGWLQDPRWALPALVLISLWGFGGPMLIFLAGLQNIPASYYEAAELDGAGAVGRFRHVTVPMLSPVIFFNWTMGIIGALQVFDLAYVVNSALGMQQALGGPQKSTLFYVLNLYDKSFVLLNVGVGSAMAWLFLVMVLAITLGNFWLRRFWVQEGGQ